MPELPEVETIRQDLIKRIKNKKISDVEVRVAKIINTPIKWFQKRIKGAKIVDIKRRGKLLILNLSNGYSLLVHLKLTGQLIYRKKDAPLDRFTHVIFYLSPASKLYFNDLRKFGYIKLIETKKIDDLLRAMRFGPEPLDKSFTLQKFESLLTKRPLQQIKPLLMDQGFIAGVGNVYAQEACFYAKVRPTRRVKTLIRKEIKNLYESLIDILKLAIKKRGTSVDTYRDLYGQRGRYDPLLKVYGRKGKKCYRCGGIIKTIQLKGRGTSFCPHCQK